MKRSAVTSSPLPPQYAAWMDDLLPGPIPGEPKATCHDCAMCRDTDAPAPPATGSPQDALFYDPQVKCCSYTPILWNFLTGNLLADGSPEAAAGRVTVERRIDAGIAVTPLGLERPPAYNALYQYIPDAFGRTRSMRCPHYLEESGLCGVWRHRESTCVTWFCKHERGVVGKAFWSRLHQLLRVAEEALARWTVLELDLGAVALSALFPQPGAPTSARPATGRDLDNQPDPAIQRRIWGRWAGRERDFYRAAAGLVRPLDWGQVASIGGADLKVSTALVAEAYRALVSTEPPVRPRSVSIQLQPVDGETCQITTYSPLDPLLIPVELATVLHYFDGRPTRTVLTQIERERHLRITPDLITKLVDFGVLSATESSENARDR